MIDRPSLRANKDRMIKQIHEGELTSDSKMQFIDQISSEDLNGTCLIEKEIQFNFALYQKTLDRAQNFTLCVKTTILL